MNDPVVLIPGAGGSAWFWHLVQARLCERGYDALAVDLPAADRTKGLPDYADAVVAAIGGRTDVTLVAQSMGAFTAPLVWQRVPTRQVVFVNAMIPLPGETPGDWWENVGSSKARIAAAESKGYPTEFDLDTYFLHDIPAQLLDVLYSAPNEQADRPFEDVCTFDGWPDLPIHAVASRDDRFFPVEFEQRLARDRLGLDVDVVPGGHLSALSHPDELAEVLAGYLAAAQIS
ncbi:MAG: alpha/beta fold hydrolase [Jatrophihabitantaceae bacterium]